MPQLKDKKQLLAIGIIVLRFIQAPFIFLAPVAMAILSVVLDLIDAVVFANISSTTKKYHDWDKWADLFWYGAILFYVLSTVSDTSLLIIFAILFLIRLTGHIIFYFTKNRLAFLWCPNIFEAFFWFYLLARELNKPQLLQFPRLILILTAIAGLKLIQEYFIHMRGFMFSRDVLVHIGPKIMPWRDK